MPDSHGVCTKERRGMTAEVLVATPCTDPWERERWFSLKIPHGEVSGDIYGVGESQAPASKMCITNGTKQKARPKGVNLKVR